MDLKSELAIIIGFIIGAMFGVILSTTLIGLVFWDKAYMAGALIERVKIERAVIEFSILNDYEFDLDVIMHDYNERRK